MEKRQDQFDIGDQVRIRDWDDMEEQYGINEENNIDCEFEFTPEMREGGMCGLEFIIKDIDRRGHVFGHNTLWSISKDMLELISDDIVEDTKEMEEFLNTIPVKG